MGKKWVPERQYSRMPHAEERAPSLWWYTRQPYPTWADDTPMPESQCVMDTYLRQCARGRSLPKDFQNNLGQWLQALSREVNLKDYGKPRTKRYWTIPAYAFAHKLHSKTLCKRFRELEKIAKRLFPHRVPSRRADVILSEEKKQTIRQRVLDGADISAVASEFGIRPFRVGQLCRVEKAARLAEREKASAAREQTSASESTFDDDLPY